MRSFTRPESMQAQAEAAEGNSTQSVPAEDDDSPDPEAIVREGEAIVQYGEELVEDEDAPSDDPDGGAT